MSAYTMQLKAYIEMWSQDESTMSIKDRIENGRPKLFDFQYPIFDEEYKAVFETNFIRRFYTREIGFETEGLFKFNLETWLHINMPYFNKLFESELLQYDPLTNSKMDVTHTKTNDRNATSSIDGTNTSTGNQTITDDNFNRNISSDNPDSRLNLTSNDGQGVIEYASSIDENNSNNSRTADSSVSDVTSSDQNATVNDTETYIQNRTGKIGVQSYGKLITDYRNSLLRVENQIFKEMEQLFMLVY